MAMDSIITTGCTAGASRHFLLIKRDGFSKAGRLLNARDSACALLKARVWPLWQNSRNRRAARAGDRIAVYLSGQGNQVVIATATVERIGEWGRDLDRSYPLELDGIPDSVLHLAEVQMLPAPAPVGPILNKLSFVPIDPMTGQPKKKWGVAFMGGVRAISEADFEVLIRSAA
jgi:hypothetical protein